MKWWHERLFTRRCLTLQEYVRVDVVTDDMLHAQVEGGKARATGAALPRPDSLPPPYLVVPREHGRAADPVHREAAEEAPRGLGAADGRVRRVVHHVKQRQDLAKDGGMGEMRAEGIVHAHTTAG